MATLAFLRDAGLDPVQAALVLVIVLVYRGSEPILVAGTAAAVIAETVMALAADGYTWGEWIAPRLVSAVLQATVLFWTVSLVRSVARSVMAGSGGVADESGVDRLSGGGATTLGAFDAHAPSRRPAPWHMRSHVRRRTYKLRERKLQP